MLIQQTLIFRYKTLRRKHLKKDGQAENAREASSRTGPVGPQCRSKVDLSFFLLSGITSRSERTHNSLLRGFYFSSRIFTTRLHASPGFAFNRAGQPDSLSIFHNFL